MKRFRFSLESVLKLRQEQEEAAERSLASARRALIAAEQQCNDAQRELNECWSHARDAMQGGAPVCQFEQARRYAASVQDRINALELKRKQAVETVERAVVKLRVARQKREILDKLRERRLEAYRTEEDASEQRDADERATAAYARNRGSRMLEVA